MPESPLKIKEVATAIRNDDIRFFELLRGSTTLPSDSWITYAIEKSASVDLIRTLIELGEDPHNPFKGEDFTPLKKAIQTQRLDAVDYLLSIGVDPNHLLERQRPTLSAVSRDIAPSLQIEFLKRLVAHGVDINFAFPWFGDENMLLTVLNVASDETVREYLRSVGAKTAEELKATPEAAEISPVAEPSPNAEIIRKFEELFGPSEAKTFTDLTRPESRIQVHVIRPQSAEGCLTLFTTGLSTRSMPVPGESSDDGYAELYMQLPADWNYLSSEGKWAWPVQLLLDLADLPESGAAYFAAPVTSVANGEPATPLGPGVEFTSSALIADEGMERSDGKTVHFFCVIPIYSDEQAFLHKEGIPSFLQVLDSAGVGRVLSPNRSSLVS